AFASVYLINWRLLGKYKVRLLSNQYNVNRSYQFRENLVVMKVLLKIVIVTGFVFVPPFTFFTISLVVDDLFLRCFFKALFDLAVDLFAFALILRLLTADRRFEKGLRSIVLFDELYKYRRRRESTSTGSHFVITVHRDETSLHFAQLNKDWMTTRF
ncbi:hypothetical protein PFISCL1PPCAC_4347, partial [Pristionchus fissidentatus]